MTGQQEDRVRDRGATIDRAVKERADTKLIVFCLGNCCGDYDDSRSTTHQDLQGYMIPAAPEMRDEHRRAR